jgi:protein-tyrosine phosphatase
MIDTHCHILPNIDDGPADFAGSFKIARIALSQGVRTLFATPHCYNGIYQPTGDEIINACSDLAKRLEQEGLFIKVVPGAEIRVNHDLISVFDKGRLLTLNNAGAYILLEFPSMFLINGIILMIRQLCKRGVTPVIAHPERNPMILNRPSIVADLIYNGAVMQITASSLAGDFGKPAMQAAWDMVATGQVFSLGSDMHPGRKYAMVTARKKLIKFAGQKKADLITLKNPLNILQRSGLQYEIQATKTYDPNFYQHNA